LSNTRLVVTIGQRSGQEAYVLGEILGAVTSETGLLLVDGSYMNVRQFDWDGHAAGQIGGEGHGPGEFFLPRSIMLLGSTDLYVADSNYRIHHFRQVNGAWQYRRSLQMDFVVYDLCAMRGRLYASGVRMGAPESIHELTTEGEVVNSFGVFYRTPSFMMLDRIMRDVMLDCSAERGLIAAAAPQLPDIQLFSADGELVWVARLPAWHFPAFTEPQPGTTRADRSGIDSLKIVKTIQFIPKSTLLVQVQAWSMADRRQNIDSASVYTFLLDVTSGRSEQSRVAWPVTLGATASHLLTYSDEPFPQVQLWQRAHH
jgi:hypothetical protein